MSQLTRTVGRAFIGGIAAGGTIAAISAVRRSKWAADLERVNHKGDTVTLAEGPGVTVGATAGAILSANSPAYAAAAAATGLTAGAVGLYDDMADAKGEKAKGFKGHVGALLKGRMSAGLIKILGISTAGIASAALIDLANGDLTDERRHWARRLWNVGVGGGVIAGTANVINLFDLRPGRALKVVTLAAAPLSRDVDPEGQILRPTAAGGANTALAVSAAAGAAMSDDLNGKTMLGDGGANALGALLGLAFIARNGMIGRHLALAGVAALIAASEKVSFTKVIAETPVLRELDELGRTKS
jgi:UDP-N-acetylmuramyl pentapeptide phosphotransferase/UDP-N-acetylglucosamine-1-phosphate transferase